MPDETSKTNFFYQLREYGIKKFLWSFDFIFAFIIFLTALLDKWLRLNIFANSESNYVIGIFVGASTLFAITLAALAILLSFSSSELMKFLRRKGKVGPLLLLFWVGNGAYLVVILLSFIYLAINSTSLSMLKEGIYILILSTLSYALINTFYLLATVIRFGYFLDIFEKVRKK
jgi:hypothetical protein